MASWTVKVGEHDVILIDRDGDVVVIDIPRGRAVRANRAEVEDLRRKLGAALADEGEPQ
jgi:hypothetical protein